MFDEPECEKNARDAMASGAFFRHFRLLRLLDSLVPRARISGTGRSRLRLLRQVHLDVVVTRGGDAALDGLGLLGLLLGPGTRLEHGDGLDVGPCAGTWFQDAAGADVPAALMMKDGAVACERRGVAGDVDDTGGTLVGGGEHAGERQGRLRAAGR